ncbi:tetratricopeptide repeat protein [bacterium]|nr:tetratricopeptide repeat protein [bacterium]
MNQDEKWASYWESVGKAIQLGKFDHAEPLLYAALDIAEDFPSDDRRLAMTLECLAEILFKQRQLTQAEGVVKRVIAIYEARYGPNHPDVGVFTNNLGLLYHSQKKHFMAESEYQKALSIQTKALGNSHPQTLNVIANYARLLKETHREREAHHLEACIEGARTGNWRRSGVYKAYVAETPANQAVSAVPPIADPYATTDISPVDLAPRLTDPAATTDIRPVDLTPRLADPAATTDISPVDLAGQPASMHLNSAFSEHVIASGNVPARSTRKNYRNAREEDITLQDALVISPPSGRVTSAENPAVSVEKQAPMKASPMQRLLQQRRSQE